MSVIACELMIHSKPIRKTFSNETFKEKNE